MRLNRWQRIGIIASVVWALAGPFYVSHRAAEYAEEKAKNSYRICKEAPNYSSEKCSADYDSAYHTYADPYAGWVNFSLIAFVPILLSWLFALALLVLWNWAGRSLKASNSSSGDI